MDAGHLATVGHRRHCPDAGRQSRQHVHRHDDGVPGRPHQGSVQHQRARISKVGERHSVGRARARRRAGARADPRGRQPLPARRERRRDQPAGRSAHRHDRGAGHLPEPGQSPAAGPVRKDTGSRRDPEGRAAGADAGPQRDPGGVPGRRRRRRRQGRRADGHAGEREACCLRIHGFRGARCRERGAVTMSRFFVRRPIVAMVIAILMVIVGGVAMLGLPVAQYPNIVPPQIQVKTTYTGADAITVERSVATPIEQQMSGVKDMLYMQSTNANDGTLLLQVTFDIDSSIDIDQVNTQNKVAQAQPQLPTDVTNYGLTYQQSAGLPLLAISLYSPKGTYDPLFLGNYATINVTDALYRVPGVGQVQLFGTSDYAMRTWVKPDRLAKLGITVPDLANAIGAQNNVNPSGRLGADPAPEDQQFTYTVRAQGQLLKPEEFASIVVRLNPDGSTVRLGDIARIELGALTYTQFGRYNGKPSAIFAIYQTPGSNGLAVAKGVQATMQELKKRFPPDLEYVTSFDTTIPVTEGIREIVITLLETTLLVALVVFLFLQSWRATLIPLIAVPVSLIGTFALFPMLGFSANTLSLSV